MIKQAFFQWLSDDENAELWHGSQSRFTACQKRVLITKWAGAAYRKLTANSYNGLRWRMFEKTGCLLTASGEGDSLVCPEGLVNYKVPPVSGSKPRKEKPKTNACRASFNEEDEEEEIVFNEFEDEENFELFVPNEEDGNVFDLFNI